MVFKNLYLTSHEFPCRAERKSRRTDTKTQRSQGHKAHHYQFCR